MKLVVKLSAVISCVRVRYTITLVVILNPYINITLYFVVSVWIGEMIKIKFLQI